MFQHKYLLMLIYTVQHMDGEEHTYIGRKAKK